MTFRWPWETAPVIRDDGDVAEEMPPRPCPDGRRGGPVTTPRLWTPGAPLNPEDDPCGSPQPPVRTGRKP